MLIDWGLCAITQTRDWTNHIDYPDVGPDLKNVKRLIFKALTQDEITYIDNSTTSQVQEILAKYLTTG